jgi:arginase
MFGPDVVLEQDLALSSAVAQRAAGSGLLNERALLQMIDALYRRVRSSLSAGRFPFVYGADCSVLLAAVPALRDIAGRAGLVFVDGHEDTTPMDLPTVADRVWLRSADEIAADPAGYARLAVEHVAAHGSRWWLHVDLHVLARSEFTAGGAPGEVMLAGGLTWQQLTEVGASAVRSGGCAGWSLSIYNPDLDPDRSAARRIVEFVARIAPSVGR